jgi:uncharacterized protein YbcV (DUF1398 family)
MNREQMNVAKEVAELSASGKIHFGEVVGRLMKAGIERYHADYSRLEITYYTPDGGSCVVPMDHEPIPIAEVFSAGQVEAAVRQSQRGEIMYPQFTRQALAAGCVGYFVQISGKCVQYFGRNGEVHIEWFPGTNRTLGIGNNATASSDL